MYMDERREELLNEWEAEQADPHYHDFLPGYATEMDWMNAQEADDYMNEMPDDYHDEMPDYEDEY